MQDTFATVPRPCPCGDLYLEKQRVAIPSSEILAIRLAGLISRADNDTMLMRLYAQELTPGLYCFEENEHRISPVSALDHRSQASVGSAYTLLCRACLAEITADQERISVDGSHEHTQTNSLGSSFHFGCFQQADGCRIASDAASEDSWFAGFQWQVAVCNQCAEHLGWYFTSGELSFYGLILLKLVEQSTDQTPHQ